MVDELLRYKNSKARADSASGKSVSDRLLGILVWVHLARPHPLQFPHATGRRGRCALAAGGGGQMWAMYPM